MSLNAERLYREFVQYHWENPHVYELFKRFVAEAVAAKKERIGARLIAERVRWEVEVATRRGNDGFRLNDHHTPFYVRLYLRERPEHRRFFELRASAADLTLPLPREAA